MPENVKAVTASRRGILAGVGGVLLAGAAVQSAKDVANGPGGQSDAELIGLCEAFDALQRRVLSLHPGGGSAIKAKIPASAAFMSDAAVWSRPRLATPTAH